MKSTMIKIALLSLATTLPTYAVSMDLCTTLEAVSAEAVDGFEALRGDFDFGTEKYKSRISLDDFDECTITVEDGFHEFACSRTWRGDGHDAEMSAHYKKTTATLSQCFEGKLRRFGIYKDRISMKNRDTGDDITASMRRSKTNNGVVYYRVWVRLNYADPSM